MIPCLFIKEVRDHSTRRAMHKQRKKRLVRREHLRYLLLLTASIRSLVEKESNDSYKHALLVICM